MRRPKRRARPSPTLRILRRLDTRLDELEKSRTAAPDGAPEEAKPKRSRRKVRLPKVVRSDQWKPLIDAGKTSRDRALLGTLLYACLRVSEACDLEWRDLNFEQRKIHVRNGKGGKEAYVRLHSRAAELLTAHRQERGDVAPTDPVFRSSRGNKLSRVQAWRVVKEAGERSGAGDIWPHVCRHSGATHLLETGTRIEIVRDHLRHASVSTTEIYLHLADAERDQAVDRMQ